MYQKVLFLQSDILMYSPLHAIAAVLMPRTHHQVDMAEHSKG